MTFFGGDQEKAEKERKRNLEVTDKASRQVRGTLFASAHDLRTDISTTLVYRDRIDIERLQKTSVDKSI